MYSLIKNMEMFSLNNSYVNRFFKLQHRQDLCSVHGCISHDSAVLLPGMRFANVLSCVLLEHDVFIFGFEYCWYQFYSVIGLLITIKIHFSLLAQMNYIDSLSNEDVLEILLVKVIFFRFASWLRDSYQMMLGIISQKVLW